MRRVTPLEVCPLETGDLVATFECPWTPVGPGAAELLELIEQGDWGWELWKVRVWQTGRILIAWVREADRIMPPALARAWGGGKEVHHGSN